MRETNANFSRKRLFELLFAETYGVRVIKPSLLETAAWLALWDEEIAREIVRREPYLLLTAGDPSGLSAETRRRVLTRLVEDVAAAGKRVPFLDPDSLSRFAKPDIVGTVRALWPAHHQNAEIRHLLLRLIWLGKLCDCADLAIGAAFGQYGDDYTDIIAGRALLATADDGNKRRYLERIKRGLQDAAIDTCLGCGL